MDEKPQVPESGGDEARELVPVDEPRLSIQEVIALQGRIALEQQLRSGASWFGTIAWLSVLNAALVMSSAGVTFVGALDSALFLNFLVRAFEGSAVLYVLALGFNAIAVGAFLFLQKKARERHLWAFWVGMLLFGVDALIGYAAMQSWLSAAFHVFGLMGIWGGLQAARTINEIEAAAQPDPQLEFLSGSS